MPRLEYPWKRYWCYRGQNINTDGMGYPYDPESEWSSYYNSNVIKLIDLTFFHCLILLGEPGSGKSHELEKYYNEVKSTIKDQRNLANFINLSIYDSGEKLQKDLEKVFNKISKTKETMVYLFIDSLDEGMLNVSTLIAILSDVLSKRKDLINKIYIRIACRTVEWQQSGFETIIQTLWDQDAIRVLEISPLFKKDIISAAKANNIESNKFLREIEKANAIPLAIKPITLQFLLGIYKKDKKLPEKQSDLYNKGCLMLCSETNINRVSSNQKGKLYDEQRFIVAERIAAVTIFSNKSSIFIGLNAGEINEQDLLIIDLCGKKEKAHGNSFDIGEKEIREVLATGLFCTFGESRMGWGHRTYAEFLAARYLIDHKLTLSQNMSLLKNIFNGGDKIASQLNETAAWLAGMDSKVFSSIINIDPEILLKSDVINAEEENKKKLIKTLLSRFDNKKAVDVWENRRYYPRLKYQGISSILRRYMFNRKKNLIVRRAAIDIAEGCEVKELQNDILKLVFDKKENISIRENAACAISKIADPEIRIHLKPFLSEALEDPNDEMKGYALEALWPELISDTELFDAITRPKKDNLFGSYRRFIFYLPHNLKKENFITALKWVKNEIVEKGSDFFEDLVKYIISEAWRNLDNPEVLDVFSRLLIISAREHKLKTYLQCDKQNIDDIRRRRIVEKIVKIISKSNSEEGNYFYYQLIYRVDFWWLVEKLDKEQDDNCVDIWVRLIRYAFDTQDVEQIKAIINRNERTPQLYKELKFFNPVLINSPEALKMKEEHESILDLERMDTEANEPCVPSPLEQVKDLLAKFESGEIEVWIQLSFEMTKEPNDKSYYIEIESDLTKSPVWKIADQKTRQRIINAAIKYIFENKKIENKWVSADTISYTSLSGYKAFRLIQKEDPDYLNSIDKQTWIKWAPTILAYPNPFGINEDIEYNELVKYAYKFAPDEIINTLMVLIDKENNEPSLYIISRMEGCWDNKIKIALMEKLRKDDLKPTHTGCLLNALLERQVDEAEDYAKSLISKYKTDDKEIKEKSVRAASYLIKHSGKKGWEIVWKIIKRDKDFGHCVITIITDGNELNANDILNLLTEKQLADLYIWVEKEYPQSKDPDHEKFHWASPRENIAEYRGGILEHLKRRGTEEACNNIKRIIRLFPKKEWLKYTFIEAESAKNRATWKPKGAGEIIDWIYNAEINKKKFKDIRNQLALNVSSNIIFGVISIIAAAIFTVSFWNSITSFLNSLWNIIISIFK